MKPLPLAALALALAACGGTTPSSDFQDATPSYDALAVDMTDSASAGGQVAVQAAGALDPAALGPAGQDPAALAACHPHLFVRTHGLAMRANRHLWKFLRHVDRLALRKADRTSSGQATWEQRYPAADVRWTVTRLSDTSFEWKLELRSASVSDWTTVFHGQVDRANATGRHQGTGTATLDLTALRQVLPAEPGSGTIDWAFESFADHRKVVVRATDVVWDAAGDADAAALGATPRNALYVYYREPGKGGSFKGTDQMVFACPVTVPANTTPADVLVLSRWFRAADGAVHGRSDAHMVGGQLPATGNVQGVVCHAGAAEGTVQSENYWMMKEEDLAGATVQSWGPVGSESSCDPLFGPVPAVDGAVNDFSFASIDFTSTDPAPFPVP